MSGREGTKYQASFRRSPNGRGAAQEGVGETRGSANAMPTRKGGSPQALKVPSITEEGEMAGSDSRRSETSGQALERERTDEARATTVRQEGVVAPRIAGSNVDGDSISDSENGFKQLI